jgi:tetraacyldisaccharide 4'-kinase
MRTGIENWLLGHWYNRQLPPWYLRIFEPVYRSAFKRAQKRQRARSSEAPNNLPLIVVGNITAGGSGKTPLVIRLCQLANELGLKPGIASTGYGRQSRETMQVYSDSDSSDCGDEPVMLAQRTGVPVVVASRRIDAVKALNELDLDLVISDDGLQHTDLGADIEICVVDGQRGLGNGHLIPAGPLREPVERLQVVDHVVSNGDWNARPDGIKVNVMRLTPLAVKSLDDFTVATINDFLETYREFRIHAVAGIGNPQRFFSMLQALGFDVQTHAFADHHGYVKDDFSAVEEGTIILMTEKDAVKCRSLGLENSWYVEVEARLPDAFERILKLEIATLIEDRRT